MKCATVTLIREGKSSPMLSKTYNESVRGIKDIVYTDYHVVFVLGNDNEVAYKADRIHEFVTYEEEE